jgi:predicted transcriptional regulator
MANVSIKKSQLDSIYQSLNSLNISELEDVMQKILGLRKEKLPTVLSEIETDLLKKINIGVPAIIQKRYDKLLKSKQKETLSDIEYEELIEISSYIENHDNQRLVALIALAQYRNQSLDELLVALDIKPRIHVA